MTTNENELLERIAQLEKKIEAIDSKYEKALQRTEQMYDLTKSRFERIPDIVLLSDSFLKRAFAAWGLVFVAGAIITMGLLILQAITDLFSLL